MINKKKITNKRNYFILKGRVLLNLFNLDYNKIGKRSKKRTNSVILANRWKGNEMRTWLKTNWNKHIILE